MKYAKLIRANKEELDLLDKVQHFYIYEYTDLRNATLELLDIFGSKKDYCITTTSILKYITVITNERKKGKTNRR